MTKTNKIAILLLLLCALFSKCIAQVCASNTDSALAFAYPYQVGSECSILQPTTLEEQVKIYFERKIFGISTPVCPGNTDSILAYSYPFVPGTNCSQTQPTTLEGSIEIYFLRGIAGKSGGGGGSVSIKDSAWTLFGNAGTSPGTNFLGTTDAEDFEFKQNNIFAGIIDPTSTLLGVKSQYNNKGTGNTFIGAYTGYSGEGNPSYSTAIGFAARTIQSNQLFIGNDSSVSCATQELAFYGALSPNGSNDDGSAGQLFQSNGALTAPSWITTIANGIRATTQLPANASTLLATTRYADYVAPTVVKFYNALGWAVKGENPMYTQGSINSIYTLGSETLLAVAVWINDTCTITGINWVLTTPGSYTNIAYNGWGLSKINIAGNGLSLLDSTPNNTQLFTSTANTWQSTAFTSTYQATPGLYFVYMLYQETAQVTAPVMAAYTASTNSGAFYSPPLSANYFFYGYQTGQTILPATRSLSAFTKGVYPIAIYLY